MRSMLAMNRRGTLCAAAALAILGCGEIRTQGPTGERGPPGEQGSPGIDGAPGARGEQGPPGPIAVPAAVEVPCDQMLNDPSGAQIYAEHLYPGRTIADLASVRALGYRENTAAPGVPTSYLSESVTVHVADGRAAVACGLASGPLFVSVTFVGP